MEGGKMEIILYKTADENIKLRKKLSEAFIIEGTLRSECSILSPTIELDTELNIATFNYAYIKDFNRYYYIVDIVAVGFKLWKISLKCDVLMSYSKAIGKLNVNVARNKAQYNLMLEDNSLSTYANSRTQCYNFPNRLTANANQFKYYLTLIGGE